MKVVSRRGHYSFDDFCSLVRDGQKADLINGVIYMASPDNTEANDLFMWLGGLLHDFVEVHDRGKVYGSRVAFRLSDANSPEPDIAFVKKEHLQHVQPGHVDGPPDLAVEIVSPESVERDYEKKRELYRKFKVPEYWIVDEELKKVTVLLLDRKGKYREVRPKKGVLQSQVLPGFWVRVEWLWQETRPRKLEALSQILAKHLSEPEA